MVNEGGKPDSRAVKMYTLGIMMDMNAESMREAKRLFDTISNHPQWQTQRSNDALMVDCLYIMGNRDSKLSQQKVIEATKRFLGKGTQPKPHLWRDFYEALFATV